MTTLKMGQKFKKTPAGEIPVDWTVQRLGDLVDIQIGGTPSRNNPEYWDTEFQTQNHWASIADMKRHCLLSTKERLTDSGIAHSNAKRIAKGTVLMSFKLTIGRVAIAGVDLYTNEAIAAFLPHRDISPEFLYYTLPMIAGAQEADVAVKGRTLNKAKLNEMLMIVPPLREQKKIAEILSSVDIAIEKTNAVIDKEKGMNRELFEKLFSCGIGHSKFKDTAIGRIPSAWDIVPLKNAAVIERGKFHHRPRNEPRFYGGRHPFVQTGDVTDSGGRIREYSQTLNEEGLAISKLFPKGTIVITIAANIGETAIAEFDVAFPDSLIGIVANEEVDNRFLEYYLRTRKRHLNSLATQSAQKNINLETLRPYPIPLPPKAEQSAIADILDAIGHQEQVALKTVSRMRSQKAALMFELLTGKIRV
ncbi:MAG: restriction endonuclease subunit S [Elusimicrobiota bacterium]